MFIKSQNLFTTTLLSRNRKSTKLLTAKLPSKFVWSKGRRAYFENGKIAKSTDDCRRDLVFYLHEVK